MMNKAIIIGATKTGKTSLLERISGKQPSDSYTPTPGLGFERYTYDGEEKKLLVTEVAGASQHQHLVRPRFLRSDIVCLNFSYDNLKSLDYLLSFLQSLAPAEIQNKKFIVVGSKASLTAQEKQVTDEAVESFLSFCEEKLGADRYEGADRYKFVQVDAEENTGIQKSVDNPNTFCSVLEEFDRDITAIKQTPPKIQRSFPKSYQSFYYKIPKDDGEQDKLQALRQQVFKILEDYSGYRPALGVFSKAGLFHPGRHHRCQVKTIIENNNLAEPGEFDISKLVKVYNELSKIEKKSGGSLDRRVQLIKSLISRSNVKLGRDKKLDLQQYNNDIKERFNYS
jgi:GTPase SAR1 family protein